MSGLENPSDAQSKYVGPEPLQGHMNACDWVPVGRRTLGLSELTPTAESSDKEKTHLADGDKNVSRERTACCRQRCCPTPELTAIAS